jgi:VWFA-related protein
MPRLRKRKPFSAELKSIFHAVLLFVGFFFGCAGLSAQTAPLRSNTMIVAETKLVQIFVTVLDDKGRPASGLKATDFEVYIDGIKQAISNFANDREPISCEFVTDVSESMYSKNGFVQEALYSFLDLDKFNGEKEIDENDEFALITFGKRAVRPDSFFVSGHEMRSMIAKYIQPTKESTALFDAVNLGMRFVRQAKNRRRFMLIVTDGGDNHSRFSLRDTKRFAEEVDMPIYAVMASPAFVPWDSYTFPGKDRQKGPGPGSMPFPMDRLPDGNSDYIGPNELRGPSNLKSLADATGGAVFTAKSLDGEGLDGNDLGRISRAIMEAAKYATYTIAVTPERLASVKHPKNWDGQHKVEVKFFSPETHKRYKIFSKHAYRDPTP